MKVNFTGVKPNKGFAPIIGWRDAVVENGEQRISQSEKNAGSTYVSWTLNITDDQDTNRKVWYITSLTDGGLPTLLGFLEAVGFDSSDGFDSDEDVEKVVGSPIRILCAEDDRGKTKISAVDSLGGGASGSTSLLP